MVSRIQPNKVLLDIEDCVSELKRESADGSIPINDDSTTLHRFQEKIELILLLGLIEKPGLLGQKKSYWNYICTCLNLSKRNHDGINFVKSIVALKTPLGRGRAFIRFCLTQKCLADTLQSCFMNEKISRDFYLERSLPVQEKLWCMLVTSLYDLNELHFDLSSGCTELDISWPKFARKIFTPGNENFLSRNMSALNLHSSQSENNSVKHDPNFPFLDFCSQSNKENLNTVKLMGLNEELSQQNKSLQKEVKYLEEEKLKLQCDIQNLQKEYLSLQQQLSKTNEEHFKAEFNKVMSEVKDVPMSSTFTSPEVTNSDSSVKIMEETMTDVLRKFQEVPSGSVSPSVKSKVKSHVSENCSKCALQQDDYKTSAHKIVNSFDVCSKNIDNPQKNKDSYIPQNHIYISELLLEIKTVIDDMENTVQSSDITVMVPNVTHLKKIRNCLEERFSSEINKSKSYLNFTNLVENVITCIKNFTTKQENIINSLHEKVDLSIRGNQNLYSRIRTLKDLLQSYGFLKARNEREIEPENIFLSLDAPSVSLKSSYEDFLCDIANEPGLKRIIVPLLPVLNSSFTKLNRLNEKIIELQFGLDTSQELNNNLITRVQDQEIHLKGVTKEIEEAQQLVSVLKKQHRKLQSAEGILKYDLQEKRKLLTKLKQQLENTREDFNLVRIKNSKSEAEWQDLHKEFMQRNKQTSEESGFIDDKSLENHDTSFSSAACDCSFSQKNTSEKYMLNKDVIEISQDASTKGKRLELLEEQCQSLYSNLLQSSKKRQEIDQHLENMCKTIEKKTDLIQSNILSNNLSADNNLESATNAVLETSSEDNCQSNIHEQDIFANSSHSSLDVESFNSECNLYAKSICNDANCSDSSCYNSSKATSCALHSPTLQIGMSADEKVNETDSSPHSESNSEFKGDNDISSCESAELNVNNQNSQLQSMSHVDSILIKKKDLEESLKNLGIGTEVASIEKESFPKSDGLSEENFAFQEERKNLLNKVQDLERKLWILSTEVDRMTQQLLLSEAAKEHEVTSLQFQLNSQALEYERSLKEFCAQSKSLENMKETVTEQEQLILALENALSEIRSDRENEKEHQWQELEDIHIALEMREQECINLCQELQKSMSEVEQEHNKNEVLLSQLEMFKTYNQEDKESMNAEILHLKQYSRELQKKLLKLLKEKDILWKRNNHLCHIQKIKIDDRWMHDSEVSSCLSCKNNFSFMLRKHHCRLCGRIFCYSCSNNWVLTASSSKRIRSCNECFVQHTEIEKVVRRGSDVPHIEVDSEDEDEHGYLSLIPASRFRFDSEMPSSVTDSVISLPITQKQSTPHFSSVPDIRFVFKPHEEIASCSISFTEEKSKDERENLTVINDTNKTSEVNSDDYDFTSVTIGGDILKICKLNVISVDEIRSHEYGLSGNLVINPQERNDLPIFCHTCPVVLKWSFNQNISLTITNANETCSNNIFYQASNKMKDEIELSIPGYYVLHFDNTSRETKMEIQYIFYIKD